MKNNSDIQFVKILIVIVAVMLAGSIGFICANVLSVSKTNQALSDVVRQFEVDSENRIDDQVILGTISIAVLKLEYPIIKYNDNASLNITVCDFSGSGLNEYGNTVLVGKRNKSGLLFADLGKLNANDIVKITDSGGRTVTYRMLDSFVTVPDDSRILECSFEEIRELTLVSISANGSKRYVFKFIETE